LQSREHGRGGITRPEWREKHLALDERWNVPLGRTVPFTFDTGEANILLVITYELVMQQVPKVLPTAPDTLKALESFTLRRRKTGNKCRPLAPIVDEMRCKPDREASSKADEKPRPEHEVLPFRTSVDHAALR
jgi:hypothetical protein